MKITQITVGYKRVWQTKAYESLTEEITLHAEIEGFEDPESCALELLNKAEGLVKTHASPLLIAEGRIKPQETYKISGLEVNGIN